MLESLKVLLEPAYFRPIYAVFSALLYFFRAFFRAEIENKKTPSVEGPNARDPYEGRNDHEDFTLICRV